LSASDAGGTTSYTYNASANALASIARPDGTHAFYSYDAQGRLAGLSADGGIGAVSFAYTAPGEISATDALGTLTRTDYSEFGLPAKLVDAAGHAVPASYDAQG